MQDKPEPVQRWRPSRWNSMCLEFGTIERATKEIPISDACDLLTALEDRAAELEALVDDAREYLYGYFPKDHFWSSWLARYQALKGQADG